MKRKNLKVLVACILVLSLMSLAACHHGGRLYHSDADKVKIASHMVEELNLDSGQGAQLKALLNNFEKKREGLDHRTQIRNLFVSQLKNEVFDEEYLRQETSKLIREMETVSEKFIMDLGVFHSTLSEEQKVKLASMISRGKGPKSSHR